MFQRRLFFCRLVVLVALGTLIIPGPVTAQYLAGSTGGYTSRGPLMYGPIPGYGTSVGVVGVRAPTYGGYYGAYGYNAPSYYYADNWINSPVFMTSLNYPGVYGAYSDGPAVSRYLTSMSREPSFFYSPLADGYRLVYTAPTIRSPAPADTEAFPVTLRADTPAPANIDVRVPADATLWFQGVRTNATGSLRHFVSPPLSPGRDYSYEVTADWTENGRRVVRTRTARVHAGENLSIDFTPTQPEAPMLQTIPLPTTPKR
jgi:uncharacterized protein (TIGR03000 family)